MLEKSLENINIEKSRVILLLKADFDMLYEIIFNNRLISKLEVDQVISYEILGSRRSQVVTYLALNKKLIADLVSIRKVLIITMCTDTTNCYDRVAYLYMSLYA